MYLPFSKEESLELVKDKYESAAFPSRNLLYYSHVYDSVRNGKIKPNLAAFIFGPFWLFYRKAYAFGLIILVLSLIFPFVTSIFMGLLGNHLYFHFLSNEYQKGVRAVGINKWIGILLFPCALAYGIGSITVLALVFILLFLLGIGLIVLFFALIIAIFGSLLCLSMFFCN